jgi:hypothetical protein
MYSHFSDVKCQACFGQRLVPRQDMRPNKGLHPTVRGVSPR